MRDVVDDLRVVVTSDTIDPSGTIDRAEDKLDRPGDKVDKVDDRANGLGDDIKDGARATGNAVKTGAEATPMVRRKWEGRSATL